MRILLFFVLGAIAGCNSTPGNSKIEAPGTVAQPKVLQYAVLNVYPHDTTAFTQGLVFYNNSIYEGTGMQGESQLRKLDLATGSVEKKLDLAKEYFGEGIAILNNKIYQLTWENHVGFVYNLDDFKLIQKFDLKTQGWGITTDGTNLIYSDGSNFLYYLDPATFQEVKRVSVQDNNGLLNNINELEYVNGYIYANIWETNYIIQIDPSSGDVISKTDFTSILDKYAHGATKTTNVLNGIAYDSSKGVFYITGKYWPNLFEIKFN